MAAGIIIPVLVNFHELITEKQNPLLHVVSNNLRCYDPRIRKSSTIFEYVSLHISASCGFNRWLIGFRKRNSRITVTQYVGRITVGRMIHW